MRTVIRPLESKHVARHVRCHMWSIEQRVFTMPNHVLYARMLLNSMYISTSIWDEVLELSLFPIDHLADASPTLDSPSLLQACRADYYKLYLHVH